LDARGPDLLDDGASVTFLTVKRIKGTTTPTSEHRFDSLRFISAEFAFGIIALAFWSLLVLQVYGVVAPLAQFRIGG
jgi:hypothetical protein